jgi:membrane-anchored glycerophosphoryl diester phosphodiesterase (GDPDase)
VLALLGVAFLSALLVFIGFVLFVIPGIYAGVRLVVAAPAAVLEKRGPQAALRRSWDLVAGNWWRVFGIIAVVTLLALGLELILGHLVGSFTGSSVGLGLSTAVVDILVQPIQSIALTLLYFDLVGRSGGVVSHSPQASSRDSA